MKISELLGGFEVFMTNEEKQVLKHLQTPALLSSFTEHDQFVIEGLIRKSLVIKIGNTDPKVIANEL